MGETSVALVRRMLWNRDAGKPPRPQPVIILLGPVGSGKTRALRAISQDLNWGVVHAGFDFGRGEPTTSVEVLMDVVHQLSKNWRNRPKPRFVRFVIALLAVQIQLEGSSRAADRDKIREVLEKFRRFRWTGEVENLANTLAGAVQAARWLPQPFTEVFSKLLPLLIRPVRRRIGKAIKSLADFPRAEGADPLDALVTLNRLAHQQPPDSKAVTEWLFEAFLADVRENHRRMAKVEEKSPCSCVDGDKVRHLHNWVLLLDNIHKPAGAKFVAALRAARESYRFRHPDDPEVHDALLVVASSGRWQSEWNAAWRPVWQPEPEVPGRLRTVPVCHEAKYEDWARKDVRDSPFYPVSLDTLPIGEIAEILTTGTADPKAAFVHWATGGLPGAVRRLAAFLGERDVVPGARDVLAGAGWESWLKELELTDQLPGVEIKDFVTEAPFATAPWLIPLPAQAPIKQQHVARILTELRTALWVSTRDPGGAVTDHVFLHPWVATNLVSALADRAKGTDPSYTEQFTALLRDPDTESDPVRQAYCRLALGQVGAVVTLFTEKFDLWRHEEWVDRLKVVISAPDNLPLDKNYSQLYEELVNADIDEHPRDRGEVRNNVARLVAAGWLTANPRAVRGPGQCMEIASAFQSLHTISQLPHLEALQNAANCAPFVP